MSIVVCLWNAFDRAGLVEKLWASWLVVIPRSRSDEVLVAQGQGRRTRMCRLELGFETQLGKTLQGNGYSLVSQGSLLLL